MTNQSFHTPDSPSDPKIAHRVADSGLLILDLSNIKPYEHNPRKGSNPEYDRIKDSIRMEGIDHPLVVTQRPDETSYLIHSGGNTRLQILQELYHETGNKCFRELTCIYRPWTSETDVLLAHLRENDLRGDLTFLDKATAVREAKRLIQEEQGGASMTQTQLAEIMRTRGYALSQGLISQMEYVVDKLLHLVPTALEGGMGRPQVERIRQLERATRALWLERTVDTETEFEMVFEALCRRYDSVAWNIGNLRRALEAEIAERRIVNIQAVSMTLDAFIAGHRGADAGTQWITEADESDDVSCETSVTERKKPVTSAESQSSIQQPVTTRSVETKELSESLSNDSEVTVIESISPTHPDHASSGPDADVLAEGASVLQMMQIKGSTDLKSLRARAWTLASRLAQRNGLDGLVLPHSGKGLGYLLHDVPDPALVDQLDEDTLAQVSMVWWYLAAAAEMTVAPVEQILPALGEDSVLRRALEDQDAGLLFSSVWTLDPGHMGFRLWCRLDDRNWRDLVDLMETYRALHQVAESSSVPLWQ